MGPCTTSCRTITSMPTVGRTITSSRPSPRIPIRRTSSVGPSVAQLSGTSFSSLPPWCRRTPSNSVLTPAMLQGDFSALTANGIQLYDTQNSFAPYSGNQIPVVNPVAQYLAAHPELYPAPNATPTDGLRS